jgi:hypothetical protein
MKHETTFWSIEVSDGWVAQKDEDCTSFFHPDGVGSLQVSEYHKNSGNGYPDDLVGFVAKENIDNSIPTSVVAGDFRGLSISSTRNDRFMRKWFLLSDSLMLYVTYNCQQQDEAKEVISIESMLNSLKVK